MLGAMKRGSTSRLLRLTSTCVGLSVLMSQLLAGEILRVSSPHLQLGVDGTSGQIVELIDRASKWNLANAMTNSGGLWELDFALPALGVLRPASARAFEVAPSGESTTRRFTWSQFGIAQAPELRVEVTVRLDTNQTLSRWQMAVRNTAGLSPKTLKFPRLLEVLVQPNERLAVPVWLGQQAENPRALLSGENGAPKRFEWRYPGHLALQCLALTSEGGTGLYLACDDSAGQLKDFAVFGSAGGGMNFEVNHRLEADAAARSEFVLPYSMVLGSFQGDWFNAAMLYRPWATNQPWAKESRLARGSTPAWVTNTALWVWNRGSSSNVIDPAVALQKKLGLPVSVFWHWWHGCAYDTGFPEYLPPREGDAAFTAALQRAHEHDVRGIVYMNQRLWGMTTTSWTNESAERFAVKGADGQVRPEVYNTFTKQPCASMCMGTEFWRNKYAGLATTAFRQLGVDGIYMDQACSSLACFDPQHGHTIGGGTYWMRGFQLLANDIRRRCETRGGPALAGEGCGENWLPYLDVMLALEVSRERYAGADGWEPIPFFHSVYHGYGVFYGNYSSLTHPPYDDLWPAEFAPVEPLKLLDRKFSRQFCLEQARAFVWGQQPTIANFLPSHLQDRATELEYALRLAKVRAQATEFLLLGEMLPPPRVEAPTADLEMSRLSIYAGQRGGVKEFQKRLPMVWAAAWRSPDRRVAIAVTSISDQPLTASLEIDAKAMGLAGRGSVYRMDQRGRRLLGKYRADAPRLKLDLAPLDACLLELKPD